MGLYLTDQEIEEIGADLRSWIKQQIMRFRSRGRRRRRSYGRRRKTRVLKKRFITIPRGGTRL